MDLRVIGVFGFVFTMGVWLFSSFGHAQQSYVTIGTAGVSGVYYPLGGALCRLLDKERKQSGVRCAVEATDGSAFNVGAILARDLDFAIVQSDVHKDGWDGRLALSGEPDFKKLRSVFSLYSEPLHLVVRKDANIERFEDVKGKSINVGNPGSGHYETMKQLMKYLGWTHRDFAKLSKLPSLQQSKALCDKEVDAIFFVAGVPSQSVREATTFCDTKVIAVTGPWLDGFLKAHPQYSKAEIPAATYRGLEKTIMSFGPKATLLTSSDVADDIVYLLTRTVMQNMDEFRTMHPAFSGLRMKSMVKDALSAPLHPGAKRFYREQRLIGS